jgi:hypothetical protein
MIRFKAMTRFNMVHLLLAIVVAKFSKVKQHPVLQRKTAWDEPRGLFSESES